MSKSLKFLGHRELNILRARVRRQRMLGRITRVDADAIEAYLDAIEARIIGMRELNSHGDEIEEEEGDRYGE